MEFTNQDVVQADLGNSGALPALTQREKEVLHLLGKGTENKLIAFHLGISTGTVKVYSSKLFKKIGVGSRLQAGLWARDHNV